MTKDFCDDVLRHDDLITGTTSNRLRLLFGQKQFYCKKAKEQKSKVTRENFMLKQFFTPLQFCPFALRTFFQLPSGYFIQTAENAENAEEILEKPPRPRRSPRLKKIQQNCTPFLFGPQAGDCIQVSNPKQYAHHQNNPRQLGRIGPHPIDFIPVKAKGGKQ